MHRPRQLLPTNTCTRTCTFIKTIDYHYELNFGPLRAMTLNDIIEKNDLRQFHSDIILSPVAMSVVVATNYYIIITSLTSRPEYRRQRRDVCTAAERGDESEGGHKEPRPLLTSPTE